MVLQLAHQGFAQNQEVLHDGLLDNVFAGYHHHQTPKRRFLSLKGKSVLSKINPLTYVSAGLLFFYQRVVSEQIQSDCMYETSCSNYTKFSIEKLGIAGFLLGINQWNNCFPTVIYDEPKYKRSDNFKVINEIE